MRANDPDRQTTRTEAGRAARASLRDAGLRARMDGRRVFVSSVMDSQMTPDREALQAWLVGVGAEPVMWETIALDDRHAEPAFLEGVDRSDVFVLLVGAHYGVPDTSGYAPTHKEANRARERGLPGYLFIRGDVRAEDRAAKVTDWLRSLAGEFAAATYRTPAELCELLGERLAEAAADRGPA